MPTQAPVLAGASLCEHAAGTRILQRTITGLTRIEASAIDYAGGSNMPGDPKECRQHAKRCGELAQLASTPEARDRFLSLQMAWIRLAAELDQAESLINALQDIEAKPPTKAA
jgi:hypothetical protein